MTERSTRHPFGGALYELQSDGNVKVTDGERQGLFAPDGRWLSGTLRESDPQLCVWVANNPAPDKPLDSDSHLAQKPKSHPLD